MTSIEKLSPMRAELALVETPAECATLAEKAKAVLAWAKHIGLSLEEQNRIARFRLDCMRKAGLLLMGSGIGKGVKSLTLSDFDVDKNQSRRWQQLARIDEALIESYVAQVLHEGSELTHAGLLAFVADHQRDTKAAERAEPTTTPDIVQAQLDGFVEAAKRPENAVRFGCIYADPPWRYGNQATRASTDKHYGTMSVDEIAALPIREIAADNAHLHLWTTNAFLFDCKRIMEAWGFEYKSCFVWVKPRMGIGNYWRVSHEFLLLGIRGDCPFQARNEMSWANLPRGRHSAKPDKIRQTIEKVSPGPRIELFARDCFEGWSAWGNQTKHSLFTAPQGGA